MMSIFYFPFRKTALPEPSGSMLCFRAGQKSAPKIRTNDEIEDLRDSFQSMILEINRQILDIQKQEHENSVVSYKLLATQIDPHFIYNTMNIINIMARQENTKAIIDINTALVRILQERLNSKLSICDTVRREYQTMRQYQIIMDYRYRHQIQIHYDIDKSLMDIPIPKNILQPLVENSFYHGFGNIEPDTQGQIDVLIYSIEQELIIEVSDNGLGMKPERLHEILHQSYSIYRDKKPHIGINNIRQRLSFLYKEQYQMEIHSTPSLGTTIIITIPLAFPEEFLREQGI